MAIMDTEEINSSTPMVPIAPCIPGHVSFHVGEEQVRMFDRNRPTMEISHSAYHFVDDEDDSYMPMPYMLRIYRYICHKLDSFVHSEALRYIWGLIFICILVLFFYKAFTKKVEPMPKFPLLPKLQPSTITTSPRSSSLSELSVLLSKSSPTASLSSSPTPPSTSSLSSVPPLSPISSLPATATAPPIYEIMIKVLSLRHKLHK